MRTIRLKVMSCVVVIGFCMLLSSIVSAAGVYDGMWEGQTSSGQIITFTVVNDIVTELQYNAKYSCPTGSTPAWGHSRWATSQIVNNKFTYYDSITAGHIIDGSAFPAFINGSFNSLTASSGTIKAGLAAYTGVQLQTQSCLFSDNWTVQKTSTVPVLNATGEYDLRLE